MGYQVIAKKVNLKFLPKQTDRTIIDGFISLLDKYWFDNDIKQNNILLNLKEIPKIKPVYTEFENVKIREIEGLDIFKKLNLENFMYKYTPLKDVHEELKNKSKNTIMINDLVKLYDASAFGKYTLFNTINSIKKYKDDLIRDSHKSSVITYTGNNIPRKDTFLKNESKILYKTEKKYDYIDVSNFIYNKENINNLIEKAKINNIKAESYTAFHIFKYNDFSKMYNNILFQILLLKYILNNKGEFNIITEIRNDFINDFLILLNYIFDKVYIHITSNKIGRLTIHINAYNFLGLDDKLYNQIYDILINTDKEIISIFDSTNNYINCDLLQNNIFNQTKKIINTLNNNQKLISQNINKIEMSYIKRTINDVMTYLIK